MGKLNQVIAIEKGVKSRIYAAISDVNKILQKADLFSGFSKVYEKIDEEGEELPPESRRVQALTGEMLHSVAEVMTALFDVTARKDFTNCVATADVEIDGKVIIAAAPVTFLLFLEKQLTDMRTLFGNLPVLDEGETWNRDINSGLYKTSATKTHRTKKIAKPIVLLAPTEHHPGQAQLISEDVIAGFWSTVKMSGAMPRPERNVLVERVEALLIAVKRAREAANMVDEVTVPAIGAAVFDYLFGDVQ